MRSWLSKNYLIACGIVAVVGLLAFAACIYFVAHPAAGADDSARSCEVTAADTPSKPNLLDEEGVMRIVRAPSGEVLVNNPVCIVLAGVAPGVAAGRLTEKVEEARLESEASRADYNKATELAGAAARVSSDARLKADAAEKDNAANAADLRSAAIKAAADAARLTATAKDLAKASGEADMAYEQAAAAQITGLPPIQVTPFLDGHRAAQASIKATASAKPQAMLLNFGAPTDANTPAASFWRDVLNGGTTGGVKKVHLTLARAASDSPETNGADVSFRIYVSGMLVSGAIATACLILCIALLASQSILLRDNASYCSAADVASAQMAYDSALQKETDKFPPDAPDKDAKIKAAKNAPEVKDAEKMLERMKDLQGKPKGPYSLARTQMAVWLILTVTGFIFLWLTLGQYVNVITSSVLVLLGINATTGLIATKIPPSTDDASRPDPVTKSFLQDILADGDGVQLQRVQVVIWTLIIAVIFIWNVVYDFMFVAFDTNLLLMMGIAQAAYIGFKPGEKPK